MKQIVNIFIAATLVLFTAPAYAQTAPATGVSGSASSNWSGYVATGSAYTGVSGSWVVPAPAQVSGTNLSADAAWVGIGGYQTHDLIQAGTEAEVLNGSVIYQAWYEALPAGQVKVPLSIHAGDSVSVTLSETAPNVWHLLFVNNTTRQLYQTDISYVSSKSSADWIQEMPLGQFGNTASYVPLDMFDTVQFRNAYTTTTNGIQPLSASGAQPMTMLTASHVALATPSDIGPDGMSFSVARTNTQAADTQVPIAQARSWRRDGQVQVQILRQMQAPIITRDGDTIHIQFFLVR